MNKKICSIVISIFFIFMLTSFVFADLTIERKDSNELPPSYSYEDSVCGDDVCHYNELRNCEEDCDKPINRPLKLSNFVFDESKSELLFQIENFGDHPIDLSRLMLIILCNHESRTSLQDVGIIQPGEKINVTYYDHSESMFFSLDDCQKNIKIGFFSGQLKINGEEENEIREYCEKNDLEMLYLNEDQIKEILRISFISEDKFLGYANSNLNYVYCKETVCGDGVCNSVNFGLLADELDITLNKTKTNSKILYGSKVWLKRLNRELNKATVVVDNEERDIKLNRSVEFRNLHITLKSIYRFGLPSDYTYSVLFKFQENCPEDCEKVELLCGNGVCDSSNGERSYNCPEDCSKKWYVKLWDSIISIFK